MRKVKCNSPVVISHKDLWTNSHFYSWHNRGDLFYGPNLMTVYKQVTKLVLTSTLSEGEHIPVPRNCLKVHGRVELVSMS